MLPILLSREEVRELVEGGELELRRSMPSTSDARRVQLRYGRRGERRWVREGFSSRIDGDRVRLRYPADPPGTEARVIPAKDVAARFRTATYRTWPGRYMPRPAARRFVEVADTRLETGAGGPWAVVRLKLAGDAGQAEGDGK
jgi:hypothetical protein